MPRLRHLWAGMVTDDSRYAKTDSRIVLIINLHGEEDILHHTFPGTAQKDQERGQANLYEVKDDSFNTLFLPGSIDTDDLNISSIRVGIRGADLWKPDSFFLWGREQQDEGAIVPLGLVIDLHPEGPGVSGSFGPTLTGVKLSTDASEGPISFALPRVELGDIDTQVMSLLMLMTTADEKNAGTDDEIELQLTTRDGRLVVDHTITDTSQNDQERAQANVYFIPFAISILVPPVKTVDGD